MTFSKKIALAAGLTAALVLSGCGGGGGSDGPSTPVGGTGTGTSVTATSVPDSTGNSVTTFLAFLVAMASSETSDPLTMSNGFTVPADETNDPIPTT